MFKTVLPKLAYCTAVYYLAALQLSHSIFKPFIFTVFLSLETRHITNPNNPHFLPLLCHLNVARSYSTRRSVHTKVLHIWRCPRAHAEKLTLHMHDMDDADYLSAVNRDGRDVSLQSHMGTLATRHKRARTFTLLASPHSSNARASALPVCSARVYFAWTLSLIPLLFASCVVAFLGGARRSARVQLRSTHCRVFHM